MSGRDRTQAQESITEDQCRPNEPPTRGNEPARPTRANTNRVSDINEKEAQTASWEKNSLRTVGLARVWFQPETHARRAKVSFQCETHGHGDPADYQPLCEIRGGEARRWIANDDRLHGLEAFLAAIVIVDRDTTERPRPHATVTRKPDGFCRADVPPLDAHGDEARKLGRPGNCGLTRVGRAEACPQRDAKQPSSDHPTVTNCSPPHTPDPQPSLRAPMRRPCRHGSFTGTTTR
jgi:hypothetical protein